MTNEDRIKHEKTKKILKIIGITLIVIGGIFAIVGFVDFFASMGGDGFPTLFWMCFIGLPMVFIGVALTIFSFKKEISTYIKNESVPVLNEMGEEIKPAITSITDAVSDALDDDKVVCSCGEVNDKDSKFCKNCGKPLTRKCPVCGEDVQGDSNFCNHCGTKL